MLGVRVTCQRVAAVLGAHGGQEGGSCLGEAPLQDQGSPGRRRSLGQQPLPSAGDASRRDSGVSKGGWEEGRAKKFKNRPRSARPPLRSGPWCPPCPKALFLAGHCAHLITLTRSWKALSTLRGGSLALVSMYGIWKAKLTLGERGHMRILRGPGEPDAFQAPQNPGPTSPRPTVASPSASFTGRFSNSLWLSSHRDM